MRDVVEDDGLETRHLFEVEGLLPGRRTARQSVPAGQYASLAWVLELLGAEAIIETGNAIKDRARVAIQYQSEGHVERARVYTHTGWQCLSSGEHVYLHAGGAIGSQGSVAGVEVAPPGTIARFRLPDPPSGEAEREAVRASLAVADERLAPDRLAIPVLAAAYRAPLGPCPRRRPRRPPRGPGRGLGLAAAPGRQRRARREPLGAPGPARRLARRRGALPRPRGRHPRRRRDGRRHRHRGHLGEPLRGCDAVQLAAAKASGCALLVAADRRLCQAARSQQLEVLDLDQVQE